MGVWVELEEGVEQVDVEYFGNLFESSNPIDIEEISVHYRDSDMRDECNLNSTSLKH